MKEILEMKITHDKLVKKRELKMQQMKEMKEKKDLKMTTIS